MNLDSGGTVTVTPFGPATSGSGTYTVAAGQSSGDLNSTSLASAGGATLKDGANNALTDFSIPAGQSLKDSRAIVINTGATTYTVTFAAGANGTITGTTPQTVASGSSCTAVTAAPNTGYTFVNWTGTGGFVNSTDNPLTVTNVTAAMNITANFQAGATPPPVTAGVTLTGISNITGSSVVAYGTATGDRKSVV